MSQGKNDTCDKIEKSGTFGEKILRKNHISWCWRSVCVKGRCRTTAGHDGGAAGVLQPPLPPRGAGVLAAGNCCAPWPVSHGNVSK